MKQNNLFLKEQVFKKLKIGLAVGETIIKTIEKKLK